MSSIVAIVGRPNVGKSTLFNRLIGKRHAIIAKEAGTTRDRIFHPLELNKKECILVDTGGLDDTRGGSIEDDIQAQAKIGIEEAEFILFIVDGTAPLTTDDFKAAEILRKTNKKTLLVINKCDNPESEALEIGEIYKLGFGEPVKISAIHNLGIDILKHQIEKHIKKVPKHKKEKSETGICLLGRPNVGKSSLFNALIGQEKVIVSDVPGTTRDAIDTEVEFNGQKYNLIDTAGLRRRGKREGGIEKFSAMRSIGAVERCDVACLIIDANEGVKNQDCHVIEYILEKQKGLIIIANKIDLFEKGEEERDRMIAQLRRRFSFVPWAPVIFTSAKNRKNITKLFELATEIKEERSKRIKTAELNNFTQQAAAKHHASTIGKTAPKIFYASQVADNPPVFVFLVNDPKNFHFSYVRYLENRIREEYGFTGTPIKLKMKARTRKSLADLKKKQ